jgi:hypothetical protein
MAVAAEEHGREIIEVYLQAMRGGDWRAAEALMSPIYGKPTETVVTHTPAPPEKAVLASMTLVHALDPPSHRLGQRAWPAELDALRPFGSEAFGGSLPDDAPLPLRHGGDHVGDELALWCREVEAEVEGDDVEATFAGFLEELREVDHRP